MYSFDSVDAEVDDSIHLIHSNVTLDSNSIKTPLICISNYVYNGLVEDLYSINNKKVQEGYAFVETDRQYVSCVDFIQRCREINKHDPSIINRMRINYIYKDITPEQINELYEDKDIIKTLE